MRVLVTGATGFVGHHAARALLESGHAVRALVRDPEKARRVLGPLGMTSDDLAPGDMTDRAAVRRALAGCDAVLHSAASVSVTRDAKDLDLDSNLAGTRVVIGEAVERGLHAVHVSSLPALMTPGRPVTESTLPSGGKTPYSRSKAEADRWVRERLAEGGEVSIVYPSGVIGPDDPGFSESVKAYRSFLRGTLSVGAVQFVDARDLARLLVRLLETRHSGPVLAAGHYFSFDALTAAIERVTGARIPRIRAPGWLIRTAGRAADAIARRTGRTFPLTGEGTAIATLWERVPDSKRVSDLGVAWRPPEQTLADLFRWYVEAGRLPASAVPAIEASRRTGTAGGHAARPDRGQPRAPRAQRRPGS